MSLSSKTLTEQFTKIPNSDSKDEKVHITNFANAYSSYVGSGQIFISDGKDLNISGTLSSSISRPSGGMIFAKNGMINDMSGFLKEDKAFSAIQKGLEGFWEKFSSTKITFKINNENYTLESFEVSKNLSDVESKLKPIAEINTKKIFEGTMTAQEAANGFSNVLHSASIGTTLEVKSSNGDIFKGTIY